MTHNIYTRGENPAISLYNFWRTVLEGMRGDLDEGANIALGSHGWGIVASGRDPFADTPVLHLGRTSASYSAIYSTAFSLDSSGRFRLRRLWGYYQRDMVQKHTFLSYGGEAGQYQWYANPAFDGPSRRVSHPLSNFEHPVDYLSESVMGSRGWDPNWFTLEESNKVANGWTMVPSKYHNPEENPRRYGEQRDVRFERQVEAYAALRARRYARQERRWRQRQGLDVAKPSVPVGKVRVGSEILEEDEAIRQMIALLDTRTPARTKSIAPRGPKEAMNGDSLVTTHDA